MKQASRQSESSENGNYERSHRRASLFRNFFGRHRQNGQEQLREALEDYIEELDDHDQDHGVAAHESALIGNILKLRTYTVSDVMIPRADIIAVDINTSQDDLMKLLSEHQHSRLPVYRETLDDMLGTIHIKDILSHFAKRQEVQISSLIRPVPIVSPSLPALDLLLKMQADKKHMVLVIDEYGGIDGLATIGDLIEAIVGEFDDEFDIEETPQLTRRNDGSLLVDARLDIETFEEEVGAILTEEEREEVDTLGGLVFYTASRIPARGEIIQHDSGMVFEIVDADQRRINRLRIQNLPESGSFDKND